MASLPHKVTIENKTANQLDQIAVWCLSQWPNTRGMTWSSGWPVIHPVGRKYSQTYLFQREEDAVQMKLAWG